MHPRQHTRPFWQRAQLSFVSARFIPTSPDIDSRPVITRMAEALNTLNAEPEGATRRGLLLSGFTKDEIDEHFEAAELRAKGLFVRQLDEDMSEPEPDHLVLARMRVAIGESFPSRQFLTTDLFGRNFTKDQQDRLFAEAYSLALKDACGLAATGAVAVQ